MKIIVQNIAVEYQDEGSGPVILMLHGWKDSFKTFDEIVPLLNERRIIRLDMPGFGESEAPKGAWDVGRYVDFVNAFIQKLAVPVDTIVGHSFGGRVAIKGVGSGILKPKYLVLIAAAGLAKKRTLRNSVLAMFAKAGRLITSVPPLSLWQQQLRRKMYEALGSDYFRSGSLKDTFVKVVNEDLSEYTKKITIPTLLIWGRQDSSTPLMQAERIHDLIENSQLDIVHDAGHFVHRERPREVAGFINDFLKK